MKAIAHDEYGPPDVLQLRDVDKPRVRDDDVLVGVHAAGVDPGVWHLTTGEPYLVRLMGLGFRAPKMHVRGDEVFGSCGHFSEGSFAEYTLGSPERLAPKPANLDD